MYDNITTRKRRYPSTTRQTRRRSRPPRFLLLPAPMPRCSVPAPSFPGHSRPTPAQQQAQASLSQRAAAS